eukprot:Clim_evm23s148 gene=Clim_evmTU23s148
MTMSTSKEKGKGKAPETSVVVKETEMGEEYDEKDFEVEDDPTEQLAELAVKDEDEAVEEYIKNYVEAEKGGKGSSMFSKMKFFGKGKKNKADTDYGSLVKDNLFDPT